MAQYSPSTGLGGVSGELCGSAFVDMPFFKKLDLVLFLLVLVLVLGVHGNLLLGRLVSNRLPVY